MIKFIIFGIILVISGIGPFHKGCNLTITNYCPLYESTLFNGKVYYADSNTDDNNGREGQQNDNTNHHNCVKSTIRATDNDGNNCTLSSVNIYGNMVCFNIDDGDNVNWYKYKGRNTCNRIIDVENSWWAGFILMCVGCSMISFIFIIQIIQKIYSMIIKEQIILPIRISNITPSAPPNTPPNAPPNEYSIIPSEYSIIPIANKVE
jgi:hypothetical protein